MKRALALALLLSAAVPPATAFAAPSAAPVPVAATAVDPAIQALVDRYVAWRGGAAFSALASIHQKVALETAGLKGVAESWSTRDGAKRDSYDLGAFNGATALGPDGAWSMEQGVVEDMPAIKATEARRAIALDFTEVLRGRGGASLTRLADETRDGRAWAVVRAAFGDADTYDAFIDAKTGEMLGWRIVEDRRERFVRLGDWRMVDGVRMAFLSEELHANAGENVTQRMTSVELNRPIDPALFARPATKALATFAGGAGGTEPVPFDFFNSNRIVIPATVNGHPIKVLLDSGADVTVLDKAFAESIGVKPEAQVVANGTGGQQDAALIHDLRLDIGSMRLTAPTAAIIDLGDISKRLGIPMPVILGAEVFKQLIVDIDFTAHTIAFHQPEGFTPPAGAVMVPITMTGSVPSVPASIEGGPEVQLDFDIGNGGPLLVFPAYWEAHGMLKDRKVVKSRGGAVGGMRDQYRATVRSLTFAGVTFHDVPAIFTSPGPSGVDSAREPGNIGLPIYSRFRMITDYPHGRLWMVPNPKAVAEPFRRDRSGLSTAYEGDHLRVVVVDEGSPAEAAGWKVGDLITAVDGQPIGPGFVGTDRSRWNFAPAGTTVKLSTKAGEIRTLVLKDYY